MSTYTCESGDEEYILPSVEALLAGTLALLTGYAQAAPDCPHRLLMANKLVSNLFFLSGHPQLSPPMQTMLANLRSRWQIELEKFGARACVPASTPTHLWHGAAAGVQ